MYCGGKPASGATIERTLRVCGQILADRGFADPRRRDPSQHALDRAISGYIQKCKDKDPGPVRQHAIPATAIQKLAESYGGSAEPRLQITGALVVLAFYFLLRVGEYTPRSGSRETRTVPLKRGGVSLWRGNQAVSRDAPWEELCQADGVTINLENSKNGQRGCVLHHTATGRGRFCPVRAAAKLLDVTRGQADDTPIGSHADATGQPRRVTAEDIRSAVRAAAAMDDLESRGYNPSRIGSHSLRSGGAVALKLAGYDTDMIKKMGRWSSGTYLTYIQTQIAELTTGVASAMSQMLTYHVVG